MDQRAAQAEFLFHAAGKFAGKPVREGVEPGALQQLDDALVSFTRFLAKQAAEELEVFGDRQIHVEVFAQALRHIGNPRADGLAMGFTRHVTCQNASTLPDWIRRAPATNPSNVDLPTPSGPTKPDHGAGRQGRS